jgi:hypothetical protein
MPPIDPPQTLFIPVDKNGDYYPRAADIDPKEAVAEATVLADDNPDYAPFRVARYEFKEISK